MLYRASRVALIVLAACKSSLPAMEIDGGPDGATPDAAIDGAPDAPNAPDAAADAALVDMAPDGHGPYADPFAPLQAMPPTCSPDHWCWMSPTPAGNSYDHVFATGPDNVWMIGGKGIALQWDGTAWHDRTPPGPALGRHRPHHDAAGAEQRRRRRGTDHRQHVVDRPRPASAIRVNVSPR